MQARGVKHSAEFIRNRNKLARRVRTLSASGYDVAQIARLTKKSRATIRSIFNTFGILTPFKQKQRKLLAKVRALSKAGNTPSEIAARLSTNTSKVYWLCQKNELTCNRKPKVETEKYKTRLKNAVDLYATGTKSITQVQYQFRLKRSYLINAIHAAGVSRSDRKLKIISKN